MGFAKNTFVSIIVLVGIIRTSQGQGCFCTDNYQPFCGTDEKTYPNLCQLECAQKSNPYLKKKFEGVCAVRYEAGAEKGYLKNSPTLQASGSSYGKTTYVPPPKQYIPPRQTYPTQNYKPYVPPKQYIPPKQTYPTYKPYVPPKQVYTPTKPAYPNQQYTQPPKTYIPPQQSYIPPQQTYIPPQKPYVPPQQTYTPTYQQQSNSYKPQSQQPSWAPSLSSGSY